MCPECRQLRVHNICNKTGLNMLVAVVALMELTAADITEMTCVISPTLPSHKCIFQVRVFFPEKQLEYSESAPGSCCFLKILSLDGTFKETAQESSRMISSHWQGFGVGKRKILRLAMKPYN